MNSGSPQLKILVTGASGGLGGALARHYAASGVHLALWGRNLRRLTELAETCRTRGATVTLRSLDIADIPAAVAALIEEDEARSVDLALFASGLGDVRAATDKVEDPGLVARLSVINFAAPAAMAAAMAARMADRKSGRIVLIGSAAGFHALPFAAAYSGSKAGLTRFSEALRLGVREHGVGVTLVSPGFIDTAAGRQVPGPKPLMLQPEEVAARIAQAVERGKAHAVMPWPFAVLRLFDRLLPRAMRDRLLLSLAPPG
ncbi:MAG: family NAD(P)-dependent oxidoreductase [Novosphingobium lindaniclasticum]|jgi:short-subunit dehydrogenase|uniref:SDR family NAD(P)-dependent oxidoreductase n=1 Tax=Novosphingobium lindaniclasticum TaxID=1329895 RepID=UPI0024093949|nr:SDR family NAD(P)-dependent oxidoreductase [Novosphingobium lindaniclasticum]MDF2639391.1 family NAD(P)-dependent oxidoreductase [Novosphingobium lindaniclasticum]